MDSARYRLAQMLLFGKGVPKDENYALKLLEGQTQKITGIGDPEFQIAEMYKSGYDRSGNGADLEAATKFYGLSAKKGNRGAQYFFGNLLIDRKLLQFDAFWGLVWIYLAYEKNMPALRST